MKHRCSWLQIRPDVRVAASLLLVCGLLACHRKQDDALLEAARNGDVAIAETVIAQGARVNVRGENDWPPLMWASLRGNDAIVRLLLDHGADVRMRNRSDVTALMLASLEGHAAVVETLIARGAEVNAKDCKGNTALMASCYRGKISSVKLLLKHGAEMNARDANGNTALLLTIKGAYVDTLTSLPGSPRLIQAAKEDLSAVMKILLEAGADVHLRGSDGKTALEYAAMKGETNLVKLLIQPMSAR